MDHSSNLLSPIHFGYSFKIKLVVRLENKNSEKKGKNIITKCKIGNKSDQELIVIELYVYKCKLPE